LPLPPKRTVGDGFRRLDEMADLIVKMHDSYDEEMAATRRKLEKRMDNVEDVLEDAHHRRHDREALPGPRRDGGEHEAVEQV